MSEDAKQTAKTIAVSLISATLIAGGSSWLGVQIGMAELETRLAHLESREVERKRRDERRDQEIDDVRSILIRVDERTGSTDRRVQRLERAIDQLKRYER